MKKVFIEPGCITCGNCQFVAPEVFEVTDVSRVKQNVQICQYKQQIEKAVKECPVNVIKIEE